MLIDFQSVLNDYGIDFQLLLWTNPLFLCIPDQCKQGMALCTA